MPEPRHPPLEVHASDHDGCPRRFYAEHVQGLDDANEPAKVGTAIHRCAEAILKERKARPASDFFKVGMSELRRQTQMLGLSPQGALDALDILEDVLAPTSRISLWAEPGWKGEAELRWGLVDTGDDFIFVENPDDECAAAGTIDLVQRNNTLAKVDDYKTVRRPRNAEDAFDSWQLRLYAFAILRRWPDIREVDAGFLMLRHGYRAGATFLRGDPWEEGVATRIRHVRAYREVLMDAATWEENPGPWCQYCPVLRKCEAMQEAARQGSSAGAALDDVEAARLWLGLKSATSSCERAVRSADKARDGEPLPLGDPHGTVLGWKGVAGWEVLRDYESTMARLRQFGMSPETEREHFRFCASHHFASRVVKVLKLLGVDEDGREELVVPIAKRQFTTFVPEPEVRREFATLEEAEAYWDMVSKGC